MEVSELMNFGRSQYCPHFADKEAGQERGNQGHAANKEGSWEQSASLWGILPFPPASFGLMVLRAVHKHFLRKTRTKARGYSRFTVKETKASWGKVTWPW